MGDPYYQDCLRTGRLLRERLGLVPEQALVTFQSRFGSARWLEPYTTPTLMALAHDGGREVDVVYPGFLADCLETLEEIQVEGRDALPGGRAGACATFPPSTMTRRGSPPWQRPWCSGTAG